MSDETTASELDSLKQKGAQPNWRRGVYGGAVVGGLFWGLVAWLTVGAPGDTATHVAADGHRLILATAAWFGLALVGAALVRCGGHLLCDLGLALLIGPTAGWLVFGSLALQSYSYGWVS